MKLTTKMMAEISITAALALLLGFVKVTPVAQGGSVSLAMLPVFFLALRRGWLVGSLSGVILGLIQMLTNPFVVHPVQFILDYPLAFGCLGICGLFVNSPILGVIAGGMARFAAHTISGIIFFASYAPSGVSPLVYSLTYNASYMIPEIVINCLAIYFLTKQDPGLFEHEQKS